jgi:very-short-patch-repair endonuclease
MTPQEIRLWLHLGTLRPWGFHFRRQAPFRGYILDFVRFRSRLVNEVDGGQHSGAGQAEHDDLRDRVLRRQGFRVLRIWNRDVDFDLQGATEDIATARGLRPSASSADKNP